MNFVLQALQHLSAEDFLMHIDLPNANEHVLFDVPPNKYPMQPWLRAMMALKTAKTEEQQLQAKTQLKQWFNFDLNPNTFVVYAQQQQALRKNLEKLANEKLCNIQTGNLTTTFSGKGENNRSM